MNFELEEKDIFYNVGIGQIFKCQGAFWTCLHCDNKEERYPAMCLKVVEFSEYSRGDLVFFDNEEKVEIYTLTE